MKNRKVTVKNKMLVLSGCIPFLLGTVLLLSAVFAPPVNSGALCLAMGGLLFGGATMASGLSFENTGDSPDKAAALPGSEIEKLLPLAFTCRAARFLCALFMAALLIGYILGGGFSCLLLFLPFCFLFLFLTLCPRLYQLFSGGRDAKQ